VAHLVTGQSPSVSGLLVLFLMTGLGFVGFLDDFIKISKQRSLGLRSGEKLAGQTLVAVIFAILALQFPNDAFRTPASTSISFVRDTGLDLAFSGALVGVILFVIWANIIVAGTSNGVNLTDGLDGLATGASVMVFAAYVLIGIWQFNQNCQWNPGPSATRCATPTTWPSSLPRHGRLLRLPVVERLPGQDLHGRHRARWPSAGGLAGLAILTRTELLVVILGGLFVSSRSRSSSRSPASRPPANGCSAWHRCNTTSNSSAGQKSRS
jgi:phospho-N-acetylmuramoyl-pentapeptide-transferase